MIPVTGVLLTLLGGVAVAVVGAIVYAYAVRYIPFVYITFFCTIAFGALIGFVMGLLARAGRLRNRLVTLVLMLAVTLIAYYFAWLFWVRATLNQIPDASRIPTSALVTSPALLWDIITTLNEAGTWSLRSSSPVSGWFLTLIWFAEAAMIFGLALLTAAGTVSDDMFCETCNRWVPGGTQIRRTVPADPITARQRLEARDFNYMNTLAADPEGSQRWWSFNHRRCETCENLQALSLIESAIVTDEKGNTSTKTNVIVDKLLLTPQEAQALLALAAAPPPPASPDPTAKWRSPPKPPPPPIPLEE
jgi:hypothetical protein